VWWASQSSLPSFVTSLVTGTRATQQGKRTLLVGAFMVTSAPILLSGYWIESPAFWMALGMFSQIAGSHAGPWYLAARRRFAGSEHRLAKPVSRG
jgi:hypothetical protein